MNMKASTLLWVLMGVAFLCTFSVNVLHDVYINEEGSPKSAMTMMEELKDGYSGFEPKIKPKAKKSSLVNKSDGKEVLHPPQEIKDESTAAKKSTTMEEKITTADDTKNQEVSTEMKKIRVDTITRNKEGEKEGHTISGLSCAEYGGPSDEIASEMVYWSDIPSDSKFMSPFKHHHKKGGEEMFMTFEPDGGGWNNIRMAMETVLGMAHAMGRTLVMPPRQGMYLLRKDKGKQNIHFSFQDFFHFESMSREHDGLDIISMEEFLTRQAMTGKLRNVTTGKVSFPPGNRTNWDGEDVTGLKDYLRNVTHVRNWKPEQCLFAIPSSAELKDADALVNMLSEIQTEGNTDANDFTGKPTPVDAPTKDRLRESIARRSLLCLYDQEMQKAPVVHFMCYHKMRARLLTHFYAFLFFQDWKQDLWTKRFIRDHVRYSDELMCAAARVVQAVRERVKESNPQSNGQFHSMHIRRGDFQYKATRLEADDILKIITEDIEEGATIYIATDERKKFFFQPLKEHYNVFFLDDFKHLLEGLNTNYYGMLDQLVASRGDKFFGTWHSTFTGYINRLRGYYATKNKEEGYEEGIIKSWYLTSNKNAMRHYVSVRSPHYQREFPTSWRDIDRGIEELGVTVDGDVTD